MEGGGGGGTGNDIKGSRGWLGIGTGRKRGLLAAIYNCVTWHKTTEAPSVFPLVNVNSTIYIYFSLYLSIYLHICQSTYTYVSIYLYTFLSNYLYLAIHLPINPCIYQFLYLSMYIFVKQSSNK